MGWVQAPTPKKARTSKWGGRRPQGSRVFLFYLLEHVEQSNLAWCEDDPARQPGQSDVEVGRERVSLLPIAASHSQTWACSSNLYPTVPPTTASSLPRPPSAPPSPPLSSPSAPSRPPPAPLPPLVRPPHTPSSPLLPQPSSTPPPPTPPTPSSRPPPTSARASSNSSATGNRTRWTSPFSSGRRKSTRAPSCGTGASGG